MAIHPNDSLSFNGALANVKGVFLWDLFDIDKSSEEIILIVQDEAPVLSGYKPEKFSRSQLDLTIFSSYTTTDFGPLGLMIFQYPDKTYGGIVTQEMYINIQSLGQLDKLDRIQRQKKWQLVFLALDGKVINVYEFANTFNLDEWVENLLRKNKVTPKFDFDRAKQGFMTKYSMNDIIQMIG